MKSIVLDITGKEKEKIDLPKCFSEKIREDLVRKIIEAKKTSQPYAPSPVAGKQHSASGKMRHRRHVWQTHYGRGMSRIPRKVMSRRGTQFNWVGAEVSSAVGGRKPHPPKIISMVPKKINKKELKLALNSAISATSDNKSISKKYSRLKGKKIENLPFIVESKITTLKTKDFLSSIKNVLGKDLFEIAVQKKVVRSGKGKMRGRKYKKNAGLLLVVGNKEKIKSKSFDVVNVNKLNLNDLARGGLGRLTMYTKESIKNMEKKK